MTTSPAAEHSRIPAPALDVIVCGSLHLDIVVHARALPRPDETAVGSAWAQVCGGKGGNQAAQAAQGGAATAMIGRVGADDFGDRLRANLLAAGVDASAVRVDAEAGSGMSVAILQEDGEYGAVIVSGANLAIPAHDFAEVWRTLGGARALVLQNEVPHAVNVAAAVAARQAGALVLYNAAPARPTDEAMLPLVDVLIVNRIEAEALLGVPVQTRAQAAAALAGWRSGPEAVVVTLGGDGLVVRERDGRLTPVDPIPVTVVSSHGAGDCFVGALAAALARGEALLDACQGANASAAAFVSGAPSPSRPLARPLAPSAESEPC